MKNDVPSEWGYKLAAAFKKNQRKAFHDLGRGQEAWDLLADEFHGGMYADRKGAKV